MKDIHRCQRCILPETFPGVEIGEDGICQVCREAPPIVDMEKRRDLGVELATHIHNANWTVINGETYILAQSWNPGHFFVLKQVK